ncbi:MAG: hypothetical protein J7494_14380 [Sphingobium sp.]|nr:hypothetical protein [Sphingobium sp.]
MPAALVTILALAKAAAPVDHPRTFLASIVGVPLTDREYLDSFSIETWGVTFKAVCHIPPGWRMKAGSSASPNGDIEGEASHGVTFLDKKRLKELRNVILLTLYSKVQREEIKDGTGIIPATFSGKAHIGTYGEDDEREAPITYKNLILVPAKQCPAPAP